MSETTKPKPGKPGGRPTQYRTQYAEIAFGLALAGYTDQQMADSFGISKSTFELWKLKHPKFSDSIKRGKEPANAKVAASLYEMANGYTRVEEKLVRGPDGENSIEKVEIYYPPIPTAAIFFLKNRMPQQFRDVQRVAVTDTEGNPPETRSVEELRAELARTGLLNGKGRFVTH